LEDAHSQMKTMGEEDDFLPGIKLAWFLL
jgi:hypothetical protein